MKLATVQASAIKSTFEVLKDILNDVGFTSSEFEVEIDMSTQSLEQSLAWKKLKKCLH